MPPRRSSGWRNHERASVADETARLIVDHGYLDYGLAKRKACERLGLSNRTAMPSNSEVEHAVAERNRIFAGDGHDLELDAMRHAALQAMELLDGFQPRLTGAVLRGVVTPATRVQLHVFSDAPELVGARLDEDALGYRVEAKRVRTRHDTWSDQPVYRFELGGQEIEAIVFTERARGQKPLSPVDGRPVERAGIAQVSALISDRRD